MKNSILLNKSNKVLNIPVVDNNWLSKVCLEYANWNKTTTSWIKVK